MRNSFFFVCLLCLSLFKIQCQDVETDYDVFFRKLPSFIWAMYGVSFVNADEDHIQVVGKDSRCLQQPATITEENYNWNTLQNIIHYNYKFGKNIHFTIVNAPTSPVDQYFTSLFEKLNFSFLESVQRNGVLYPVDWTVHVNTFGLPVGTLRAYDNALACFISRRLGYSCTFDKNSNTISISGNGLNKIFEDGSEFLSSPSSKGVELASKRNFVVDNFIYDSITDFYLLVDDFNCTVIVIQNSYEISQFFPWKMANVLFAADNDKLVEYMQYLNRTIKYDSAIDRFVETADDNVIVYLDRYDIIHALKRFIHNLEDYVNSKDQENDEDLHITEVG